MHISILKQALDHGLKLKKVPRVIEFNQEAWLKIYIDINTELRKKASNDFEKDFFKLMNNAVFGKTIENVNEMKMSKPIYLGLSILKISKIIIYEFWYDYMKRKY